MSVLENLQKTYPSRYYASMDKPCVWYDMWVFSSTDGLPDVSTLYSMTLEQWVDKGGDTGSKLMYVDNNKLVDYVPPVTVIPLKTQAQTALNYARTYVYNNYGILNESTPDLWVTYIKSLMAITNGTDTTSTSLPTTPS